MIISLDYNTIKAGKRHDPQNPITAAFHSLEKGIIAAGHTLSPNNGDDAEVVFVFGSITKRKMDTERAQRILKHRAEGKIIFSLDSALFSTYIRRYLQSSETMMFRIGLGDCTGEGNFLNENSTEDRYEWLKKAFSFKERDPRVDNTGPILFILQSEKGWQYDNEEPYYEWASKTIGKIRNFTDRRIILKPHPNTDRHPVEWVARGHSNIEILRADSSRRDIVDDFVQAGAVVTHSSSAACESIVEGIPTFALDKRCVVYDACEHDLSKINNLETIEWSQREQTLRNWANTSWYIKEMENPALIHYYIQKAKETL